MIQKLTAALSSAAASLVSPLLALLLLYYGVGILPAQTVTLDKTVIQIAGVRTETGTAVTRDWNDYRSLPKTTSLLSFASRELGCAAPAVSTTGAFSTLATLRFIRSGAPTPTNLDVRLTFLPVTCRSTRFPGASVAIGLFRYTSTPQLRYPRLFIRYGNNAYMVEEFSLRKDLRPTKMTCKFGDCVFRTGLRIMEEKAPSSYRSVMNRFSASANEPVFNTLTSLYDVRRTPIGQGTLTLYSGILIAANLEEEWNSGFIYGALEESFKPARNNSFLVEQAKKLAKDILKALLKQAGKALWKAIASFLGQ